MTRRGKRRAGRWLIGALMGLLLVVGGVAALNAGHHEDEAPHSTAHDLLGDEAWKHAAGAEVQPNGSVLVTALDRRIVEQDGTGGQPNPPVNLQGPRFRADGDFTVSISLRGVGEKRAYLQFYSGLPVIYDEWRREPESVRLGVRAGEIEVAIWDGSGDDPSAVAIFDADVEDDLDLTLTRVGDTLIVSTEEEQYSVPVVDELFDEAIFVGVDAEVGADWTLSGLSVTGIRGDHIHVLDPPALRQDSSAGGLRTSAEQLERPIGIGSAIATGPLLADEEYRRIAAGDFSMLTPENDFKPQFVQPRRGIFAFEEGDALVRFAEANEMEVHAHTLVWHEALPRWMREDATGETMDAHIDAVAGHYRGKVTEWDVVNEPMSDDDEDYRNGNLGLRSDSPWFESMGEGYIDRAFRRAREADPDVRLFINEYGVEEDGPRWDALLALVTRLLQRGVPIDGVGFQSHQYEPGDRGTAQSFARHAAVLADLGLEVRVSEMDVLVDDDEEGLQADEFRSMLEACLDAENCSSFTAWGFTDRYGSTADVGTYPPEPGNALPWDAGLEPKVTVRAIRAALDEYQ